jgi:hypothetical protein
VPLTDIGSNAGAVLSAGLLAALPAGLAEVPAGDGVPPAVEQALNNRIDADAKAKARHDRRM